MPCQTIFGKSSVDLSVVNDGSCRLVDNSVTIIFVPSHSYQVIATYLKIRYVCISPMGNIKKSCRDLTFVMEYVCD